MKQIIGCDISKRKLDWAISSSHHHLTTENNAPGFKQWLKWLVAEGVDLTQVWVIMEHTGLYSYLLEQFLGEKGIAFTKVPALAIKLSAGIVRGKTDKIDALRIARYGVEKKGSLLVTGPLEASLSKLQCLEATRKRFVRHRSSTICALKEYENIGLSKKDTVIKAHHQILEALEEQIKKLEAAIKETISSDPTLKTNYNLLVSIKGIGSVVATVMLIKTRNFSRFANGRKFACFCGIAPFDHSSGSSIRKKARISDLADKDMKTLLDCCAQTAVRFDPELKAFYQKRTEAGKPKRSTLNIIRNKLVARMFAIIKRQTPFQTNYLKAA